MDALTPIVGFRPDSKPVIRRIIVNQTRLKPADERIWRCWSRDPPVEAGGKHRSAEADRSESSTPRTARAPSPSARKIGLYQTGRCQRAARRRTSGRIFAMASFGPHLAVKPLPVACPSPPSGWTGDFHQFPLPETPNMLGTQKQRTADNRRSVLMREHLDYDEKRTIVATMFPDFL